VARLRKASASEAPDGSTTNFAAATHGRHLAGGSAKLARVTQFSRFMPGTWSAVTRSGISTPRRIDAWLKLPTALAQLPALTDERRKRCLTT
jgi:hypothetical protein